LKEVLWNGGLIIKIKVVSIILIISVLLFVTVVTVNFILYAGVVSLCSYFPLLILVQLLYGIRKHNKFLLLLNTTLIIFCLVFYLTTLPSYNYEDGKTLLEEEIGEVNLDFIDVEYKTIPITDKNLLLYRNVNYYYGINHLETKKFYTIDPITGQVFELEEPFY
jgi:hypothetical protein